MEVRARYVAETVLAATFLAEQERVMRRFCEVIGGDLPVRSVTKAHVVAFKDAMLQAPRVVTAQADRALSFPALVKKYAGTNVPRMKVESVRKHLTCVHTLFAFAIKNDHVDANPVDGTIPDAPKHRVGPPRIVFAADDLRLMFTSDFAVLRDEDYWLPLLGLWTG